MQDTGIWGTEKWQPIDKNQLWIPRRFSPPAQKCQHLLPVLQAAKPIPLCLLQTLYIPHPPHHSWVNRVNNVLLFEHKKRKRLEGKFLCGRGPENATLGCPQARFKFNSAFWAKDRTLLPSHLYKVRNAFLLLEQIRQCLRHCISQCNSIMKQTQEAWPYLFLWKRNGHCKESANTTHLSLLSRHHRIPCSAGKDFEEVAVCWERIQLYVLALPPSKKKWKEKQSGCVEKHNRWRKWR